MSETWKVFEINDFKGTYAFDVEVYADIQDGGGYSDEPAWREVTITDMYCPRKAKRLSKRLQKALLAQYEDYFAEALSYDYD